MQFFSFNEGNFTEEFVGYKGDPLSYEDFKERITKIGERVIKQNPYVPYKSMKIFKDDVLDELLKDKDFFMVEEDYTVNCNGGILEIYSYKGNGQGDCVIMDTNYINEGRKE